MDLIKSRKIVKHFLFKKLTKQTINEILECGLFAMEENVAQPWRVNVITHPTVKLMLAEHSPENSEIIESAACCFVIFLDLERSTNRIKDIITIGALVENILLAIHALPQIGGIWLSDIMDKGEKVSEIFKLSPKRYELMGLICVGAIDEEVAKFINKKPSNRRSIEEFTDWF